MNYLTLRIQQFQSRFLRQQLATETKYKDVGSFIQVYDDNLFQ